MYGDGAELHDACRELAKEFVYRDKSARWLERRVYEFVVELIDDDEFDLIEEAAKLLDLRGAKAKIESNPFRMALRVIFADARKEERPSHQRRSSIAQRLYFAYYHFVPLPFLEGFLKEHGKSAHGHKTNDCPLIPDLRSWVQWYLSHGEYRLEYLPKYPKKMWKKARKERTRWETEPSLTLCIVD